MWWPSILFHWGLSGRELMFASHLRECVRFSRSLGFELYLYFLNHILNAFSIIHWKIASVLMIKKLSLINDARNCSSIKMFSFEEIEHFRTSFTSQGVRLNVIIDFRLIYIALRVLPCFSSFFSVTWYYSFYFDGLCKW